MNSIQPITRIRGGVHEKQPHELGRKHVSGTAEYIDDMPEPSDTLHAYLGLSQRSHAEILSIDLDAVKSCAGVIGVLTVDDIPGHNDVSPAGKHDDPVFAIGKVEFHGQPIFAVIAETRQIARQAAAKVKIEYRDLDHVTDVLEAERANYPLVIDPLKLERGDITTGLAGAKNRLSGEMRIGGQDHFYLEGHIAFAIPGEDDEVTVFSSTQHPSETQHMVGHVLGIPSNAVTVNVRRMGGAFGGKETQANLFAAVAAIAAKKYRRAVKIRPDRDDDMVATGKRHDFHVAYDKAALAAELDAVRAQGFAIVDQELELGLRSCAVPIARRDGTVVAALNVGVHAAVPTRRRCSATSCRCCARRPTRSAPRSARRATREPPAGSLMRACGLRPVYVCDAVRTPFGRYGGALAARAHRRPGGRAAPRAVRRAIRRSTGTRSTM